jgi:hypothetical protein
VLVDTTARLVFVLECWCTELVPATALAGRSKALPSRKVVVVGASAVLPTGVGWSFAVY